MIVILILCLVVSPVVALTDWSVLSDSSVQWLCNNAKPGCISKPTGDLFDAYANTNMDFYVGTNVQTSGNRYWSVYWCSDRYGANLTNCSIQISNQGTYFHNSHTDNASVGITTGVVGAKGSNSYLVGIFDSSTTKTFWWSTSYAHDEGVIAPVSSFSCTPRTQAINTPVVCTDASTNTPTSWYWTLDAEAMGIKAWSTSTSRNFTWQSAYTGFYSVNLRANNSAGSDWENKSSYVRIDSNVTQNCVGSIASGYIRTFAYIWDRSGNMIHGADISLKDVETGAWSNYTSDADGIGCIDTLPSHTINIYGSYSIFANQYLPNSYLGAEAGTVGNEIYFLTLFPFESKASAGNTSLYVQVKDAQTKYFIPYAVVQAAVTGGATYSQSTANAGSAIFIVPINTIIKLSASAAGYSSGSATINSGTGNVTITTIELSKGIVTATPTTTIPPGGITPAITPDPHDPAITGSTTAKGQDMMNWLAMNGMSLVQLCFFITICALLGIKFGK